MTCNIGTTHVKEAFRTLLPRGFRDSKPQRGMVGILACAISMNFESIVPNIIWGYFRSGLSMQ